MSPQVLGKTVDGQTRCAHDSTELNIIAICFACCGLYYPCHLCHAECAGHLAKQWLREEWNRCAILCGACWTQLTFEAYIGWARGRGALRNSPRALRRIRRLFGTSFSNI